MDGYGLEPPGGRAQRRDLPRRRGGGADGRADLRASAVPGAGRRRRRSTRPCCGWCGACCRCRRCWRSAAPTRRPARPGCWSRRSCRASGSTCCCPSSTPDRPREAGGHRAGPVLGRLAQMPMPRPRARSSTATSGSSRSPAAPTWRSGSRPPARGSALGGVAAARVRRAARSSPTEAQALLDGIGRDLPGAQRLQPEEPAGRPATTLEVTGVLDWEFAHAGLPGHRPRQPAALRARPGLRRTPSWRAYVDAVPDAGADDAGAGPGGGPVRPGGPRRAPGREPGHRAGRRPAARRSASTAGDLHAVP